MNPITEVKTTKQTEPVEIEKEISIEQEEKDLLILSLEEFEEKFKSGNCDMAQLLALCLKIQAYANHKNSRKDKIYTLDKKADLDALAKKSEQTYNGRHVFALTAFSIIAGAITMAGGGLSFAGAFSTADKLGKIGAATSGIGQGLGMIPGPFDKYFEAERLKLSHHKQMGQHLFDDRHQSHLSDKRSAKEAAEKANQTFQAMHSAVSELLRSGTR